MDLWKFMHTRMGEEEVNSEVQQDYSSTATARAKPKDNQSPNVFAELQDTVATQGAQVVVQGAQLDAQSARLADALAYIDQLNGMFEQLGQSVLGFHMPPDTLTVDQPPTDDDIDKFLGDL
ncbi:Uncharacterized protein Fot_29976 [Forsythia ovata]|uniref:Uncharacterized protein n=1 Tax=Forsythia ovata TaxID=205694 RepID=A0ABD1TU89_9LAMI